MFSKIFIFSLLFTCYILGVFWVFNFFVIRCLLLQCWSLLVYGKMVLNLSNGDRTLNTLFFLCLCNFSTFWFWLIFCYFTFFFNSLVYVLTKMPKHLNLVPANCVAVIFLVQRIMLLDSFWSSMSITYWISWIVWWKWIKSFTPMIFFLQILIWVSVLLVIQFVRIYVAQMHHVLDSDYILFQTLIYL